MVSWFLTEEGVVSVDFVKNMPITSQYFENMKKVDHMVSDINESYVGWA